MTTPRAQVGIAFRPPGEGPGRHDRQGKMTSEHDRRCRLTGRGAIRRFLARLSALLLPLAIAASATWAEPLRVAELQLAGERVAELPGVAFFRGEVTESRTLRPQDTLPEGSELRVPERAFILLESPAGTRVELFQGCRYRLGSAGAAGETHSLFGGRARFRVRRLLDFFNVDFDFSFVALVRGTEFEIDLSDPDQARVRLDQGRLNILSDQTLSAGDGTQPLAVARIDTLEPAPGTPRAYPRASSAADGAGLAEAEARYSAELARADIRDDFDRHLGALNNLGMVLMGRGRHDDALASFTEAGRLAAARGDLPWQARALNNEAAARLGAGDDRAAIDTTQRALALNRRLYADGVQTRIAANYNNLGVAYKRLGETGPALANFTLALETNQRLLARETEMSGEPRPPKPIVATAPLPGRSPASQPAPMRDEVARRLADIAGNQENLGNLHVRMGKPERGIAYLEQALAGRMALAGGKADAGVGSLYANLGVAYRQWGEAATDGDRRTAWFNSAVEYQQKALAERMRLFPDGRHPTLADSYYNLGNALCAAGRCPEGIDAHRQALDIERALHPDGLHRSILDSLRQLARLSAAVGLREQAAAYATEAAALEQHLRGREGARP